MVVLIVVAAIVAIMNLKSITALKNFSKVLTKYFMLLRNSIQNVEEIWKRMIQWLFKIILEYCLTGLSKNHLVPLSECTSD